MSEAPPFWFDHPGILAWALAPFGAVYGRITARRMKAESKFVPDLPVFCIGNLIVGGAGKTPTAIAVSQIARSAGLNPGFLSRGYGGSIHGAARVDPEKHNARDVGDEALLLCRHAPVVVSADRVVGAKLLQEADIDLIIMDDGFQNPSLRKEYALVVIDTRRGVGNGFCMPAGPVRADLRTQMSAASAILLIGQEQGSARIVRMAAKMAKPILTARTAVSNPKRWQDIKVLAYAGIADPEKFYASLESVGAEPVIRRSFPDHHPLSDDECAELLGSAKSEGLTLVTTEKDAARLKGTGARQDELLAASRLLKVKLVFENPKMVEMTLRDTVRLAREYRLSSATR